VKTKIEEEKEERKRGRKEIEKPKRESVLQSWILKIKRKVGECSPTKPIYKAKERTNCKLQ